MKTCEDADVTEEEKKLYAKVFSTISLVCDRKIHCTVCDVHIGTAPAQESLIRMHPVLRVTHCKKCHEFYNRGDFSKGEDGSESYCRWCGQGGEVYCCSKCPYVFCKNCIVLNLSKGCVNDIKENENWHCFACAPKIMWHLRAQHWALINYIEKQKKSILSNESLTDADIKKLMTEDRSICCKPNKRLRKESVPESSCDSDFSLQSRKKKSEKKLRKCSTRPSDSPQLQEEPPAKRIKSNDEVVSTPDLASLFEQDNSDTSPQKPKSPPPLPPPVMTTVAPVTPSTMAVKINVTTCATPKIGSGATQTEAPPPAPVIRTTTLPLSISSAVQSPPPLLIRTANTQLRAVAPNIVTRKTVVGSRQPATTAGQTPVYYTINGYMIDLNTAAQYDTCQLPNGNFIQVKKQEVVNVNGQQNLIAFSVATPVASIQQGNTVLPTRMNLSQPNSIATSQPRPLTQNFQLQRPQLATIRYSPNNILTATMHSGKPVILLYGTSPAMPQQVQQLPQLTHVHSLASRPLQVPTLVRQVFSATPIGQARTQMQNHIFSTVEICQHMTGKIQTLTNSNAYKNVRSFMDIKDLYMHMSYVLSYSVDRMKEIQEKIGDEMGKLGYDPSTLKKGHLEKHVNPEDDSDEVEIVEPNTTCINLNSDNEDSKPLKAQSPPKRIPLIQQSNFRVVNPNTIQPLPCQSQPGEKQLPPLSLITQVKSIDKPSSDLDVAVNSLAGTPDVDLSETNAQAQQGATGSDPGPKKPRRKTTHKPNPRLIKLQQLQEKKG